MRAAPRHVKAAGWFAALIGLVNLLRLCAYAYADEVTVGKALLYGGLGLVFFWLAGLSLRDRSRWGYVIAAVAAALPLLGLFASAVHLLRLTLENAAAIDVRIALVGIAGLVQLAVTCILFRHLLASETRQYVWKTGT